MKEKAERVAVLAGNHGEFVSWCNEKGISPHTREHAFYISGPNCVRGQRFFRLVRYGTWHERPDLEEIELQVTAALQ